MNSYTMLDYGDIKIVIFYWEVSIGEVLNVAEEVYGLSREELMDKVKVAASLRSGIPFVCLKNV